MRIDLSSLGHIHDLAAGVSAGGPELAQAVAGRAASLQARGVARGSVVAIGHGGSLDFFPDLFAVWALGGTAACIDASLTPGERSNISNFAKPVLAAISNEAEGEGWHTPLVRLADAPPHDVLPVVAASHLDDAALILFTSGTTGAPKGVVLTFRALFARIALNHAHIGAPLTGRTLVTLPTHFGHGLIGNALTPLFAGGDIVLAPRGLGLAKDLGRLIDAERITFMSSVPTLWRMALKLSNAPSAGTLKRVHVGSAPLSSALWSDIAAWAQAETVNCLGITETANWIGGASSRQDGIEDGFVGRPWGGRAAVRLDDGRVLSQGEGEIVVQTPSLMAGYLDRPDLTAAALEDGWYRTGDQGFVDGRGVTVAGRIKDEINRAGFKIQPAEIDMLIEQHEAVAEACAFAIPDAVSGEIVGAAVRFKPGAAADLDAIKQFCRARLRREATPERWFTVDEIPRTSRGKVSREAVRKALMEGSRT
ncbi:MAG: class I adenylate-forming enzyme family protein [Micropepsaceae bacterium]